MAQTSFDAYMLPRHIGLYAGVPVEVPAHLVQRVCGTGIEVMMQAADTISLGRADLALCVGAESMSRNPIAAYTHRGGFRLGQVEFKDFLWEALLDPAADVTMGDTAENLARQYQITRPEVDRYAARSFERALAAQESGFLAGEIVAVKTETFEAEGLKPRGIKLRGKVRRRRRATPMSGLRRSRRSPRSGRRSAACRPAAIARPSSTARRRRWWRRPTTLKRDGKKPLARLVAGVAVGVPPDIMGIGPVPAIRALLAHAGLKLADIDRFEINEAFGAQVIACVRELGIDEDKLNVNGGAIAIGHPLGASGVRLALTLARELQRSRRPLWHRLGLHRRRAGHRDADRE